MSLLCKCGHEEHAKIGIPVCKTIQCACSYFEPAKEESHPNDLRNEIDSHIYELNALEKQARWLLETYPHLRDESTDKWIDFYFEHVKFYIKNGRTRSPAKETVSRIRRHLARLNPGKYGSTKTTVQRHRDIKEYAYQEKFTQI